MTTLLYVRETIAMASYKDMQEALVRQRDVQHSYYLEIKRIVDSLVRDYPGHIAGEESLGDKPEMAYGYKSLNDTFERAANGKQLEISGSVISAGIGVKIKESKGSTSAVWIPVVVSMQRSNGIYLASICPVGRNDIDCTEARLRDKEDLSEIFDALTALIMDLLDSSIYE